MSPGGSIDLKRIALDPGSITDVAGLAVGHAAVAGRPSGCTVVLCPNGAVAGVAQRGGSPGTRETDLLRPENTVQQVHAVLLTGGSAFGLDAAGGVMRWLEERGHGFPIGPSGLVVPIVPAAVIFDLWLGDSRIRPDAATGFAACEAASETAPKQGNAGAGLGATVGKLHGIGRAMKGGIGTASLRAGPFSVGALVVVNAIGDVVDADGRVLAGARSEDGRSRIDVAGRLREGALPERWFAALAGTATTIGVVATDAALDKTGAHRLAALAHHGLSRAIDPVTVHDGDTLFALSTGAGAGAADPSALGALAAECVSRAIRNAVRAAESIAEPPLPAARDLA